MYEAIILAGGFGTRLREAVPDLPKPMAPIAGKPFLAWQLDYLIKLGVTRFVLSVGYKAEIIRDYFGEEYHGAIVDYAEELKPLGTGGAIEYALRQCTQKRVFVLNGDTLCDVDLSKMRSLNEGNPDSVGVTVKQIDNTARYGAIKFDADSRLITSFGEKLSSGPGFINAGIYDIPKDIFASIETSPPFSFETEIIQKLVSKSLYAFQAGNFFIDIGIPEDFVRAQNDIPLRFI